MKFSSSQVLAAVAPLAAAFPAALVEKVAQDPAMQARGNAIYEQLKERQAVTADGATAIFEPIPMFNAEEQFIDVSDDGPNPWIAPGPTDNRGPCPGLNAFANHGFLPRNGYATITQFIDVTSKVVGMGPILGDFLAVLGASIDGDGVSWSIGGTPKSNAGGIAPSMGNGISGSHNKYESDASPTRGDLYQAGDDWKTIPSLFNQMIAMSPNGELTLDSLTKFRSERFDHQVQTNPYFFNGPFTGVLVQPAAYTFIYRFMANHSEENKIGYLDYATVADWFGYENNGDNTYSLKNGIQGQERIPYNWYKRANAYPYDTPYFLADATNAIALYPKFANIGGNMGKPNTFAGANVEDLSGGLLNSGNLLKGNNLACFGFQFAAQAKPDVVLGSLTNLLGSLSPILANFGCPQLRNTDQSQLEQFPGYSKSNVS